MAPPKITNQPAEISLRPGIKRSFEPKPLDQLRAIAHDRFQPGPDQPIWNPRRQGRCPRPASPDWLETAVEMERYVRGGESARDIVDFGMGELEGCRDTLKSTLVGTARAVRHPIQTAGRLNLAYWDSSQFISEFPKQSEQILRQAAQRKCSQFLEANNRQRGQMTGAGLTGVGLAVVPYPKLNAIVKGVSRLAARSLPRAGLAEAIPSLPVLTRVRTPLPQSRLSLPDEAGKLLPLPPERPATGFLGRKGWEMRNLHGPHPPQNSPAHINGMNYTGHSLDQMRNRGIMPCVIENAIIHGRVSPGREGCHIFSDLDNELRVVLDPSFSSIVTTMRGLR
ncbi:hypothetical protein JST97_23590 [bacterium]|nr:hypothetical protein [bacterium]